MSEWSGVEWMGDTPQTVMTTRAPAVLINFMYLTQGKTQGSTQYMSDMQPNETAPPNIFLTVLNNKRGQMISSRHEP